MKSTWIQLIVANKKYFLALSLFISVFFIFKAFVFSSAPVDEDTTYQHYFNANYKIFSVNIPKDLNFAGEKIPMNDLSIRESLDRELLINTYWQSQTLLIHKRANRWFPIIEPILKKYHIPDDFKYVAAVESGLTNVVSPQKAVGYWQLIETTASAYGLEINEDIDERYDVEKSTEAACKYFKEAYEKFGNWTLAAASYNMGMGGIEAHLKKQNVDSYYDLLLNEETSRYLFRILALKEIISRPKAYGFIMRKKDLYPPLKTTKLKVDSTITDLLAFANGKGITYKLLKIFNPWLRKNSLPNATHKQYIIEIPSKEYQAYHFEEEKFENYDTPADSTQYIHASEIKNEADSSGINNN